MYFLSSGILFGFKKPVLYFPIEEIHSMSVQTITGRTFCLVLSSSNGESIEFDMIDTNEYQGISDYMSRFSISGPQIPKESNNETKETCNASPTVQLQGKEEEEESTDEDYQESTSSEDVSSDSDDSDSDSENEDSSEQDEESVNSIGSDGKDMEQDEQELETSDENSKPVKITGMSATADAIMKQLQKQKQPQRMISPPVSKNKRVKTDQSPIEIQDDLIITNNHVEEEEIDELDD